MSRAEILRRAKARIADPARWTREAFARRDGGEVVPAAFASEGVCFCAIGAIYAEIGDGRTSHGLWKLLDEVAEEMGHNNAPYLNDHTDHATVLRMFDNAIARAEAS